MLLDAGAQPGRYRPATRERHGGSRMELSPATDDLRSLPLTGRFCYWLSGHVQGTTVVQKTGSDTCTFFSAARLQFPLHACQEVVSGHVRRKILAK